ncbi:copper transport protein [Rhizobium sp. PP-F2F-G48]|uniref:copper resistance CopC/CopD family protein n=1 Tax=Rhizobium sp. PP-F2F-G48 TaxID=2135651 RepID=UPI0010F40ED6|nr:copper resistance protein CopC [Rhizobium sp. PP-F2F-G48]TCM58147.1 copper transport protein [Rhizobium sp. PP-F2F-G48]
MLSILPLLLLASAGVAFAHAQLVSSDPADGAVLAAPPREIVLLFSEPVVPLVFRLSDPAGGIEALPAAGAGIGTAVTRLVVTLPPALASGTHSLSWRVTSADGHPIGGGLFFSIGKATASLGDGGATSGDSVTAVGLFVSRLLVMAGLVLGVGGAGWVALFSRLQPAPDSSSATLPFPAPALVAASLWLGLAATPVWIAFQGFDALGEAARGWASSAVWSAGLQGTSYGRAALLCAGAIVAAIVSLRARRISLRLSLAALAFGLAGVSAGVAGHAATAPPRIVSVPAIMLHMLGAMAWIGGLLPLRAALGAARGASFRADPDGAALRLFSRLIPFVLAALVASGLLLAIVQVQAVSNLWTTAYGRVLLAKLALVLLLVVLAAANRFLWTRPAAEGLLGALRLLRRSIVAEVVIGTMVLAVLGLWRFTPPPRALAMSVPTVQDHVLEEQGLMATLSLTPARPGPVRVSVAGLMLDGQPVDPLSVTVELAQSGSDIGPFVREARLGEDGRFQADGFVLSVGGAWTVRVTVLVDDFTSVTMTDRFDIAPF